MTSKDLEQQTGLGLPLISPKTESGQLGMWSKQRWPSHTLKVVVHDIVKNGEELLAGKNNIDYALTIDGMIWRHLGNVYYGEDAIAARDSKLIGALAVGGKWAMHDPQIVYLSLKAIASMIKRSGEREIVQQTALDYGQKSLSHSDQHMKTLDFLLEVENRQKHGGTINKLTAMLGNGDIEKAYSIVNSLGDRVRRRGEVSSSSTTSSIRTPPNSGM